jgi:hypothetical protein
MNNSCGYGADYNDYPHLKEQWDFTLCQLGSVNPYRVAVFNEKMGDYECSPYAIDVDRIINILTYLPVLSYSDETFEASMEILNPASLDLRPILEPDNWAILIDLSSDSILYSGRIKTWHKYPHGTASRLIMDKENGPVNYQEFVEYSLGL